MGPFVKRKIEFKIRKDLEVEIELYPDDLQKAEARRNIFELKRAFNEGDFSGFFKAKVIVRHTDPEKRVYGTSYLGELSYRNFEDFLDPNNEALEFLVREAYKDYTARLRTMRLAS